MLGKIANAGVRPVALGATLQSASYGQTIPVIYGRIKSALYLIWEANIRQNGSKLKKKKNINQYAANVDFLIGHNPILTPLQFWANQTQKFPLKFAKVSGGGSFPFPFYYGTYTIADSDFYAVLAVTVTQNYGPGTSISNTTFSDYGDPQGTRTLSGTWEIPLWNAAFHGPDPGLPSLLRTGIGASGAYFWTPASGNTVTLMGVPSGTINVYYAQLDPGGSNQYSKKNSDTDIPAAALRLTFEPILGDGPEYVGHDSQTGAPLGNQRIFYPCYAGLGSPDFQSAQTGLPEVQAEILGAYAINPEGDADFCDIIEDTFKQGLSQPGYATASDPAAYQDINTHVLQRGLACYDWPGLAQAQTLGTLEFWSILLTYFQANQQGNILVALGDLTKFYTPGSSVTDTAGNTWMPATAASVSSQWPMWYASAKAAAPGNAVTMPVNGLTYNWLGSIFEIGGVDTFDNAVTSVNGAASLSITTTNASGTPAFILAFSACAPQGPLGHLPPPVPGWTTISQGPTWHYLCYYRVVYQPGTYTFTAPIPGQYANDSWPSTAGVTQITLAAFKCADPPSYPRPLGNVLDDTTMQIARNQCRANGLWGSLVMDSQQKASEWLDEVYKAANTAPVWSGFSLKSIPYSEVSTVGNGAIYNSPTASGPTALSVSDFIYADGQPLYATGRKAQVDVPNLLQFQIPCRDSDYNDTVISQPMTAAIALFGSRKDSPEQMRCIVDPAVARMILNVQVNKQNNFRNTYKFKLNARNKLREPMDLIRLPADPTTGQAAVDVRLTSIEEDDQYQLDCEAEPFIYGTYNPVPLDVTAPQPYQNQGGASAGDVNTPIIFEPVPRLSAQVQQLWFVVSAPAANYGGCLVYLSTDGGSSYPTMLGQIFGNATTGASTADWPAATDPDTINDLSLDLTESNGILNSYQAADEDSFTYPCYVAGGAGSIPYELMTYAVATLTAASKYTLEATGGNKLRRDVFGAPNASSATGVDHPSGSRFAWLGMAGTQAQTGILKVNLNPDWIGKTLYFKFPSVNANGSGVQSLSDVPAYTYTPTGTPGAAQLFLVNGQ